MNYYVQKEMLIPKLLIATFLVRGAAGCSCYENGKMLSCNYLADTFSLTEASCKKSARTLVWLSPDCVQNIKVRSIDYTERQNPGYSFFKLALLASVLTLVWKWFSQAST